MMQANEQNIFNWLAGINVAFSWCNSFFIESNLIVIADIFAWNIHLCIFAT